MSEQSLSYAQKFIIALLSDRATCYTKACLFLTTNAQFNIGGNDCVPACHYSIWSSRWPCFLLAA